EVLGPNTVLETARSVKRVGTGRQPNAHRPVAGVNDAWTDGEWRVGRGGGRLRAIGCGLVVGGGGLRRFHVKWKQRTVRVHHGDAGGQRLLGVVVADADHQL